MHNIHKALRHAMLTFNIESDRTDFSDPGAADELGALWARLRTHLGNHARHEDEIMFPLLSERAPGEPRDPFGWEGEVDALMDDHVRIGQLEVELDKLLARIEEAPEPAMRRLLGREFHRTVQRYTAMALPDFDDEERHNMPRVWSRYTDEEIIATFDKVMATVSPEDRQYTMEHLVHALDPVELEAFRARMPSSI